LLYCGNPSLGGFCCCLSLKSTMTTSTEIHSLY
jgi:hypothetical protein